MESSTQVSENKIAISHVSVAREVCPFHGLQSRVKEIIQMLIGFALHIPVKRYQSTRRRTRNYQ